MQAFEIGRTLNHGVEALKRSAAPLLVGAFIIDFLSLRLGNQSSGNYSSSGSSDEPSSIDWDPNSWDTGSMQAPDLEALGLPTDLLDSPEFAAMGGLMILGLACFGVVLALFFVARCFMLTGWYRLHEECLLDGTGTFKALFSGADRMWDMLVLKVVESTIHGTLWFGGMLVGGVIFWFGAGAIGTEFAALAGVSVMLALVLPFAIFLSLRLFAADRLVALEAMGPLESMGASWRLTGERMGELVIYFVLLGLVQMLVTTLSCCLCCFSFLITVPLRAVMDTAVSEGVLVAHRGSDEAMGWEAFA